jgi:hypothetical protein
VAELRIIATSLVITSAAVNIIYLEKIGVRIKKIAFRIKKEEVKII